MIGTCECSRFKEALVEAGVAVEVGRDAAALLHSLDAGFSTSALLTFGAG